MRIVSAIACAALAPLFIAAAPEPVRLQPNSPWVVDYGQNSCRLIRGFGQAEWNTTFVMESRAPDEIDLLVTGRPLASPQNEVPARFLPVGGKLFRGNAVLTVGNKVPAVLWSSEIRMLPDDVIAREENDEKQRRRGANERPMPLDLASEQQLKLDRERFADAATAFEIRPRGNRSVILETGSMGAPLKTFDKCVRDLAKTWGIDPDLEERIVRPVWAPANQQWLSSNDYPATMLDKWKESEVSVRLLVDSTGKVTKCTALSHFAAPDFNTVTCAAISRRAHFEPAELADGTKVPSYVSQRVIFRIGY